MLSNNDGCVVARSAEVKALGIPMGVPVFKIKDEIEKYGIITYASNYTLYGDMSARMMTVLNDFTPDFEIYSLCLAPPEVLDEAFLGLSGFKSRNLTEYGLEIRQRVMQWTGIPVSIGIGATKTLAKIANRVAKKSESGVFDISACDQPDRVLFKIE